MTLSDLLLTEMMVTVNIIDTCVPNTVVKATETGWIGSLPS